MFPDDFQIFAQKPLLSPEVSSVQADRLEEEKG